MRHARPALLAVCAAALLAVAYDRMQEVRWDGGYPVAVRVERASPRPVAGLSAAVLFRREWEYAGRDPERLDSGWKSMPAGGEPFTVEVRCSGRDSGLGRRVHYVRQEVLVLRVSYADGGGAVVVAELPDGWSDRELGVVIP